MTALDFLYSLGQQAALAALLYGAWLAHGDTWSRLLCTLARGAVACTRPHAARTAPHH